MDPAAFLIEDGRLLVFYRSVVADTRMPWTQDRDALLTNAELNCQKISGKSPVVEDLP